ncbi:chemotaxis protein CheD [Candidatus Reidiella endopervernicosa]|uniref:Chemotaxis protein CheD n=1 Tax=Candidatus Reidiella endopervernicosa TaxID=2738883 RepID=A0A6N0HWS4_9GAMM|nr:chemotaxis protein CheD [Candidatus Reidiella endopervernicosa]
MMLTLHATTHSISLLPGESYFGCDDEQVETLLGSCVALVLWSELDQAGGMSHVVLPERGLRSIQHGSGYFATEALEWQLAQAQQMGLQPCRFEARIIGGGCMLSSDVNNSFNVGARNIIKVRSCSHNTRYPSLMKMWVVISAATSISHWLMVH